jgi:hypothetical protein
LLLHLEQAAAQVVGSSTLMPGLQLGLGAMAAIELAGIAAHWRLGIELIVIGAIER